MRKEKTITLNDRGRELIFKIREMPATRLESWIVRAGLVLASTGILDSKSITDAGEAIQAAGKIITEGGLAALGNVDYDKVQPLLDELLGCCEHMVDGIGHKVTPDTVDGIIEDVKTLFALRKEVITLNFDFFAPDGKSDTTEAGTPRRAASRRSISLH
jgi:hypothetical protein